MSIKDDIRDTYQKYDNIFQKSFFRSLEDFDIAEIRDQFKIWIKTNSPIFKDVIDAEDTFLYIYHYKELQEIKRKAIYLRELEDQSNYERFIQEFFDDNSPSGLQELKVHQINNESDKIWFSREKLLNGTIEEWRAERFSAYI